MKRMMLILVFCKNWLFEWLLIIMLMAANVMLELVCFIRTYIKSISFAIDFRNG